MRADAEFVLHDGPAIAAHSARLDGAIVALEIDAQWCRETRIGEIGGRLGAL